MKTKTIVSFALFAILGLSLIACASSTLDSSSLIYNNSAEYPPSSHTYGISNLYVNYVTVSIKGTSSDDTACIIYTYSDGSTSSGGCQKVPYISWKIMNSANPQPNLIVTSVTLSGGTHTYMKDFFAYGNGDGYTETPTTPGTQTDSLCGNSIINTGEECDTGLENGIACTAGYGSSCNYCSSQCKLKTVKGEYCGDGILNTEFERCDDGNKIDNDRCSNECKKPFEVVVEGFVPMIWQCNDRVVYDDATEPGRTSGDGTTLVERINNYAFEGEQIQWKVLVMDKNGIEKVGDVYVTVDGDKEANCMLLHDNYNENIIGKTVTDGIGIDPSCNARIDEEQITEFNPETMAYYLCTLTVEAPDAQSEAMHGQKDITVEVTDIDGEIGAMVEMESWFLNPVIALTVDGSIAFDNVRPGTSSYSEMIKVGNDAEDGSGVLLDMFISGTDFYDSSSSGALCPTTNQLKLSNFAYYATNGAYSTAQDLQVGRTCDSEGYCSINYGIGFNNPNRFYDKNEILQENKLGHYYLANVLAPNNKIALTFRLNLPEPCNGNFNEGNIYFWGEAI